MIQHGASPLSLPPSVASRSFWAAQAFLGFMGALLLMFALALQARTHEWLSAVENQILFEVPAPAPGDNADFIDPSAVRNFLQKQEGLEKVRLLSRDQVERSLSGWIDNASMLPLPELLQASAQDSLNVAQLTQNVQKEFPSVVVHEGKNAMKDGLRQVIALRWLSYVLVAVVAAVGTAMSLAAAFWRLDVQDEIVDLLHGLGASRKFVVQHLARSCFISTGSSACTGTAFALFFVVMGWLLGANGPNEVRLLSTGGVIAAALVPFMLALLSALMAAVAVRARYTPFRELKE